jgi:predicted HicB family RNase H-like nuclease
MMIAGKKQLFYSDNLLIKIDPALREALAAAAERERTSMSELVRRGVRAALAGHAQHGSPEAGCAK